MTSVCPRACALLLSLCAAVAQAEFRVDVSQGVEQGIPIALVAHSESERKLAEVMGADLARSGFFRVLSPETTSQATVNGEDLNWDAWDGNPAEYAVTAVVQQLTPGRLQLDLRLFDLLAGKAILARRLSAKPQHLRRLAHQAADALHEQVTGIPGAFDTRIAYVSQTRTSGRVHYRLYVADADGHGPVAILTSPRPLMSPVWSPDGRHLAYVSFEARRPQVFLQSLRDASRRALPGSGRASSAPAFSPDGRRLALAMAVDGDMEIFIYALDTGALSRFTHSPGIDTEPAWEADGQGLVFTSDRGGKPKLYRQGLRDPSARMLPVPGNYTTDAVVSADGRYLAFVQSTEEGGYGVALFEPESHGLFPLSSGTLDEAPSFAPNGFSLIYASTTRAGEQVLMLASHNGRIRQRLRLAHSDVREPAWSPYRR